MFFAHHYKVLQYSIIMMVIVNGTRPRNGIKATPRNDIQGAKKSGSVPVTNPGQQQLLNLPARHEDNVTTPFRNEAIYIIRDFLTFGNLDVGRLAINLIKKCVEEIHVWITGVRFLSSLHLQARIQELKYAEDNLSMITDLYTSAKLINELHVINIRYKNISASDGHNRSYVARSLNIVSSCLKLYESALSDLEKKWNKYNVPIVFRFPRSDDVRFVTERHRYLKSVSRTFQKAHTNSQALSDLETKWDKYNVTRLFRLRRSDHVRFVTERHRYLKFVSRTLQEAHTNSQQQSELITMFQYYMYPVVYFVILVVGLTGNGTLLLIFARHKEIRTAPSIMLFNLAIADITNLCINVPLYYVFKYYNKSMRMSNFECKLFVTYRFLNNSVIELSILSLSIQRYIATVSALRSKEPTCHLSARTIAAVYIGSVWGIAFLLSLPSTIIFEVRDDECFPLAGKRDISQVLDVFYCLFDSVLLPVLITCFSVLTARFLRNSVREIPGVVRNNAQEIARYRSARVIIALSIAFYVCFIPRSIWFFVASYANLDRQKILYLWIDEVTNYLLFFNSCLNPIALYNASGVFRRLFNKYLFRCRYVENRKRKISKTIVTRSTSLQSAFF